ncbi:MAG: hypothetical protein ACOYXU_03825 [Nitrospirota bacterium]
MGSKAIALAALACAAAAAGIGLAWWFAEPTRAVSGILLSVGASAKADPYAVAQGAVTHGEAVLIDFGDGDLAFFVNDAEEVLALVNGCGERVNPTRQEQFPVLIDARFHVRNVPPYTVEARATRYRFSGPVATEPPSCP